MLKHGEIFKRVETPAYLRKNHSRFWNPEDWARESRKQNDQDRNKDTL